MRAVCLDFQRRTPIELDIPEPREPRAGEALLEIAEIGVCATDRELASFRFGQPPAGESRLVLGHEALAQVRATGPGVDTLKPGDWVVPLIRRSCHPACASCTAGRPDLCRTGLYLERGITGAHGYFTELALDAAADLIPVPPGLLDIAVLAEPLSVVEKAIETGMRAHPMEPRTAAIAGAGPVGLLTALALQVRGFDVTVVSLEPEDHPRALLLRRAGIAYLRGRKPSPADLVFEASGAADAAREALSWLAPLGVFVLIGAPEGDLPVPGIRMLVENLTVTGIVNAARTHFDAAFADLRRIRPELLAALLQRRDFNAWRDSLSGAALAPKLVHRIR